MTSEEKKILTRPNSLVKAQEKYQSSSTTQVQLRFLKNQDSDILEYLEESKGQGISKLDIFRVAMRNYIKDHPFD